MSNPITSKYDRPKNNNKVDEKAIKEMYDSLTEEQKEENEALIESLKKELNIDQDK